MTKVDAVVCFCSALHSHHAVLGQVLVTPDCRTHSGSQTLLSSAPSRVGTQRLFSSLRGLSSQSSSLTLSITSSVQTGSPAQPPQPCPPPTQTSSPPWRTPAVVPSSLSYQGINLTVNVIWKYFHCCFSILSFV